MKKILLIIFVAAASVPVGAQQNNSSTPGTSLSATEANRLNGSKEPTIQGMPYSQWVAAEKARRLVTQNRTAAYGNGNSGVANLPSQPKSITPAENKIQRNEGGTKPVSPALITKTDAKPEEPQTLSIGINVGGNFGTIPPVTEEQKPATVLDVKGTSADPGAAIQSETVKVIAPAGDDKPIVTQKGASRTDVKEKPVIEEKPVKQEEKKPEAARTETVTKTKPGQGN